MEKRKNLCAMIPEELHGRVKQEQEALALTLAQYVEMVLEEHFKKGGKEMGNGTRTLAFQVSEELFGRVKGYEAEMEERASEEAGEIQESQEADTDAS